jgi:hypothetical protein
MISVVARLGVARRVLSLLDILPQADWGEFFSKQNVKQLGRMGRALIPSRAKRTRQNC